VKRVGRDGKAEPGTYTLTSQEAKKLRKLVRWFDQVLDSVPPERRNTMGGLLNSPMPGDVDR
jgi:hypothetical protein